MKVNDNDIAQATHEEAARVLKGAGNLVKLSVQYRPEEYNRYEAKLHELQQNLTGTLVRYKIFIFLISLKPIILNIGQVLSVLFM